jgi:hypothetical protein
MARRYYRLQPDDAVDKPLSGHTSLTSASDAGDEGAGLPEGYVFAYTSPEEVRLGLSQWGTPGWSPVEPVVVEFLADGAFDPGDAEGVAVRPRRELRRVPLTQWLRRRRWGAAASAVERDLERRRGETLPAWWREAHPVPLGWAPE